MTRSNKIQKSTTLRTHRERGQAIVLIALGMFVLILATGLAVDATLVYRAKQDLQRAIDSAALAAAYKLPDEAPAANAAYEYADLHGYDFNPYPGPTLDINFPKYDPPRKVVTVEGSTDVNLAFMSVIGFKSVQISAAGEAESAPLDIYLVLDLSESMVYDTEQPSPWPPVGFTLCSTWDDGSYSDCIAKYCNWARECDPLDLHIKPAAKYFIDQLHPMYDRVGLVVYDQSGTKIIGLTSDFELLKWYIDDLNAFDHQGSTNCSITRSPDFSNNACNKQTNIGDGIMYAHNGIASEGRQDAIWSMVLLTDGKANVYRQDAYCTCPGNCADVDCEHVHLWDETGSPDPAAKWAIDHAKDTWSRHETTIYTIAFGTNYSDYQALMIEIADWTDNGLRDNSTTATHGNFWGVPDEDYLRLAFAEIAERIYSRLLR
jgi:hypothetical protein